MANYLTTDTDLTAVADAIRTKGGTSEQLEFPQGFVDAIEKIDAGGDAEDIIRNIINGTLTSVDFDMRGTGLTGSRPFGYYALKTLKLRHVGGWTGSGQGSYMAYGSTIRTFVMTCTTSLNTRVPIYFTNSTDLSAVDLTDCGEISGNAFNGCSNLKVIVLRGSGVTKIAATTAISNTPFASGKSGGTLYVPQALISTYQSATNWSTILSYENNQILPIEGSIYETQYVDGHPLLTT